LKNFFFITLGLYQTRFWYLVSQYLKDKYNVKSLIISFDTESSNFLKKHNCKFIDIDKIIRFKFYNSTSVKEILLNLNKNNLKNFSKLIRHEKLYFSKRNNLNLLRDFYYKYQILKNKSFFNDKKNIFIQEIGGFMPNILFYELCKKNKLNHFFLETAFYKDCFHIIKNNYLSIGIKNNKPKDKDYVANYLEELIKNKSILVPLKDKKHFKKPLYKLFDLHNISRFIEKNFRKYFLKYNFVFGSDLRVFFQNLSSIKNFFFIKRLYIEKLQGKFVYYPLHVPNDYAITVRSPSYLDQISFIEEIAKKIYPTRIFIKEHPAKIGLLNLKDLMQLLNNNKNISIIDPKINNFDVIKRCKFLVTINSKSGFEAIMLRKHVFTFGDSFYKNSKLVKFCKNINDFDVNDNYLKKKLSIKNICNFFNKLKNYSFTGSLYDLSENNIKKFSNSLINLTNEK
jgi:hypothetical protein